MARHFPHWLKRPLGAGKDFDATKSLLDGLNLNTVCSSARCPNMGECWKRRTATFMVLGETCSRGCHFCSVNTGTPTPLQHDEPARVAKAVKHLNLKHCVVTMVTRDDLDDGGAGHMASVVNEIRTISPNTTVEVLVSDLKCNETNIRTVLDSAPDVFGHNIETVRSIFTDVRNDRFDYDKSLDVLRVAHDYPADLIVKSAIMLGLGETTEDVHATLKDLVEAGCSAVAIGQYLQPTSDQHEVVEFVTPDQFASYEKMALALGFRHAIAGPFVRSSYRSEEALELVAHKGVDI